MMRDHDGTPVRPRVRREADGTWSVNFWFGGFLSPATTLRRYHYRTREEARGACISDESVLYTSPYLEAVNRE